MFVNVGTTETPIYVNPDHITYVRALDPVTGKSVRIWLVSGTWFDLVRSVTLEDVMSRLERNSNV